MRTLIRLSWIQETQKPDPLTADRARKEESMNFTVRRSNGKTGIRLRIGALAITVEFPLERTQAHIFRPGDQRDQELRIGTIFPTESME